METSPIYELLPAFKERNHVIYMLLGLLSISQDWMFLLESQANNSRLYEIDLNSSNFEDSRKGFLYFLLGTVSFTGHFTRTLEGAQNGSQPPTPDNLPGLSWGWRDIGELLR